MRILIGSPVRQTPDIFELYLQSLDGLDTSGLEIGRLFVLHNSPELVKLLRPSDGFAEHQSGEPDVRDDVSHQWKGENIRQVGAMRNYLLEYTLREGYDALLMVDSDLILHPKTLQSLVAARKDIVAEVFWTSWKPGEPPMPNAWQFDSYGFYEGDLERWKRRGLFQVGMAGACTLIHRNAIERGVNYTPVPNLMIQGEDRHFCIRAAALNVPVWLDTQFPAAHLYRTSDAEDYVRQRKLVGAMLVKNEAGRYLERVLEQMAAVCDKVIVLDDGSEDETPELCQRYGAVVHEVEQKTPGVDGWNELRLRQRLWEIATEAAGDGGWILSLDADETLEPGALSHIRRLLPIAEYNGADSLAFTLHDMWDEDRYRDDELWNGHRRLWPFLVRYDASATYRWPDRVIHCGRFPRPIEARVYDSGYRVQHWGWSRPEDRRRKHDRYLRIDPNGEHGSMAQYQSILDENPRLSRWID